MRAYSYIAYTGGGKRKTGTILAETEAKASEELKAKGLFVSDLSDRGVQPERRLGKARGKRLGADLQAVFTRQMAVLLTADLPTEAALDAVRSGAVGALDSVAARAKAGVMEGQALSDALEATGAGFARYYIAALRAGERAGDVGVVFSELAEFLETRGQERAQIAAALVYPAFVASVALLVCGILMTSVAPEIVAIFEMSDRPLPMLTQWVLWLSDGIRSNFLIILTAFLALLGLVFLAGRPGRLRDARDGFLLRLPLIGRLLRMDAAVQYLRTLALVLGSRHAVLAAVDSAAEVLEISQFQHQAEAVSTAVRQGETLSNALTRLDFIPAMASQLVSAGEMSARLSQMAARAALLVENGLTTERKRIAALLEPALMMLVGGLVLMVVLAVLLPIFDLQDVVSG